MPETTRPMYAKSVCISQDLREQLLSDIVFKNPLNLGSGNDYIDGWINVDLDPRMNPDIVCNLDAKNLQIPIKDNTHDLVWCSHIMEHIWYLPQLKNEILRILQPGGVLIVVVPHYLSIDAWGDDTHVRAFSKHSWSLNYWPGYDIKGKYINLKASVYACCILKQIYRYKFCLVNSYHSMPLVHLR